MFADEVLVDGLRAELRVCAHKLEQRLKRARKGKPSGMHDGRTTCRRLRAAVDIMGRSSGRERAAEELCGELARAERLLSKTRDIDVLLVDLEAYGKLHPMASKGLADLRSFLAKKRKRAARRVGQKLTGARCRALVRAVQRFGAASSRYAHAAEAAPPAARPMLVRHFTHEEIWRRYDAVRAFDPILPGSPEALHKFRSACRELRFTIELFGPALADMAGIVADLVDVQAQIGEMHDHHEAVRAIRKWKANGSIDPTRELETYVAERVVMRDRLRAHFETAWLTHLGRGFRARIASAIEEEVPAAA
jgi:CHAD domain-containing protein